MHTPQSPLARIPIGLLVAGALVLLVPIVGVLAFVWISLRALAERFPFVADTILIALPLGGAVFIVGALMLVLIGLYNQ